MAYKYTEEYLAPIVAQACSIADVLRLVGIRATGGSHSHISSVVRTLGLDTNHFIGATWPKGKPRIADRSKPEDYLIKNSTVKSHKIRLRLIRDGLKEYRCEGCTLSEWMKLPIPLELHHVNGDHSDNTIDNLKLLCPNCHAQTDNYSGKANKK